MVKRDKRLCWNCDGTIGVDLNQCPYCGVAIEMIDLHENEEPTVSDELTETDQDLLHYPSSIPTLADNRASHHNLAKNNLSDGDAKKADEHEKKELTAFLLILPGATLALFGALLFFFAKDGTLTLAWRGNFAYFYMLGALPLLFLGWRALK